MTTAKQLSRSEPEPELTLRVDAVYPSADDVVSLELVDPSHRRLPGWAPGAHVDVTVAGGLVRQYSLCGDPARTDRWRIAVRREPESRGASEFIHDHVRPGDELPVREPRNNFPLVRADRYLFIAGGIGVTPILPMVREVARRGLPWTLLYGGRTRRSMAFVDELHSFTDGVLRVAPEDECGLLDLDRYLRVPAAGTVVYCCGPAPLIDAVQDRCATWPAGALHHERFAPHTLPPGAAFDVELAQSGLSLRVPADRSLLEALEDAGFAVTNSCRAGICGTCLVGVAGGVPDHRDDVLSDYERSTGDMILPCVSRSRTPVLVLEL